MANGLYDWARTRFLTAQLNWDGLVVLPLLLDDAYVFDAEHTLIGDLAGHVMSQAAEPVVGTVTPPGVASTTPDPFLLQPVGLVVPRTAKSLVFATALGNNLVWYGDDAFGLPFVPDITPIYVGSDKARLGWFAL